jgi:hypothetical protein
VRVSGVLRGRDRYGAAVALLVGTMILFGLVGDERWGRPFLIAVQGAALLFILHTSDIRRRALMALIALVGAAVAGAAVVTLIDAPTSELGAGVVGAVLVLVAPVAVIRRLTRHERISIPTVLGALSLYLLLGLLFAHVFAVLQWLGPDLFVQTSDPRSVDFLYFSFVTLATLGYGDLTPVSDLGKMVAVTEAVLGQLYLVSVVALLVSNVGRTRARRAASSSPDERPAGPGP